MKLCYKIVLFIFLVTTVLLSQQDTLKYPPNSKSIIPALNFKDTDVKDLFRSIAYEYKTNIMVDNNVTAKVSTALYNLQLFEVVKIIAEDNGLEFNYDPKRFIIRKKTDIVPPKTVDPLPEIEFARRKISLKLKDVDLNLVIERLREKTNKNFIVVNGTTGKISGTLNNVDFEKGLKILFQNNGLLFSSKDSIYYISRSSYLTTPETGNTSTDKKSYWVYARDGMVSLDITQAPLDRVLNDIASQLSMQIIKLALPNSNVTVRCNEVSVEKALEYLFKGSEFAFKKDKDAYIVGNKTSKSLDETRLIKLNYLRADKLKEKLPPTLVQSLSVNISLEHNAIMVSGSYEAIQSLESFVQTMDRPVAQVIIEALVIDYNLDNSKQFGITAGIGDSATVNRKNKYLPGMDMTFSGGKINSFLNSVGNLNLFGKDIDIAKLGKLPDDFYLNLKAMEERGIANVKSKPLLSTLNGHTASLKIGTVQNYVFTDLMPIQSTVSTSYMEKERIEKIEANISFEITPWVGPNNELTLEIKPEFQTPIGEFVPDKKLIPAISTRSFFSTVRIKDGETIILGGLIQEKEITTEDKVPLLGDIPFIGELFKSVNKTKTKGELMIYITPRINYGDDLGFSSYNYSK